jgi:hypothetical protein
MLEDLDQDLNDHGTSLVFAELKDPVRRKIERYGLDHSFEPEHFFPTLEAAVAAFREQTGAAWAGPGETAGPAAATAGTDELATRPPGA